MYVIYIYGICPLQSKKKLKICAHLWAQSSLQMFYHGDIKPQEVGIYGAPEIYPLSSLELHFQVLLPSIQASIQINDMLLCSFFRPCD